MSLLTNEDFRSLLQFLKELYTPRNFETFPTQVSSILPKVIPLEVSCRQQGNFNVSVTRSQKDCSQRDRTVLNLLRPHLFQAYQNAQMLTQMQQDLVRLNWAIEQLGMIILSGDGQVQLITQQAWALLIQYFQPSSHPGSRLPDNLQRWVKHHISRLSQTSDIPVPFLPLQVEQAGKRLMVRLVCDQQCRYPVSDRLEEQYLLLLQEQLTDCFSVKWLQLLGLTKREAEVLFWVAKDKNNKQIAAILGMSDRTVQKHLEHIYQKLGVQSRVAAVIYAWENLGRLSQ